MARQEALWVILAPRPGFLIEWVTYTGDVKGATRQASQVANVKGYVRAMCWPAAKRVRRQRRELQRKGRADIG